MTREYVLILVLVEHTLRALHCRTFVVFLKVLILVLVEHTLREEKREFIINHLKMS